ncbi:PKD domain-containing protein [Hyalangium sp.]|uniref:PKD domain-containing protein n=1 Tax=Hyalangium sp. TaxID=2028555 RepID=UPI002D4EA414|nr:hypothetical protein [Hyalangium sp.]HYI02763.1 hypothetical protein [Hyalangium sp.]
MSLWNSNRRTVSLAVTVMALGVLAACGGNGNPPNPSQGARAEIKVMLPQELSSADVARVHVEVRGPGIPTPIGMDLSLQGGSWQGTLIDIPAGLDRIFEAKAYDAATTLLYQGQAGPITIAAGSTVSVAILLQEVNPDPPYRNVAPTIDSVVVSANQVSPGGTITLTATAHDDNPEDTITFAWTAAAGTFSAASSASTSWVAPATEGVQVLQLQVTDSKGTFATINVSISVQRAGAAGSAAVTVGFNTWPTVTGMTAVPSVLTPNVASQLAAVIFDADGDSLNVSWGSDCPGIFDASNSATPSFTVFGPPPMGNRCVLSVSVSDGRGGQGSGTLSLLVGPAPRPNVAPQVDSTFKSSEQAGGNEVVTVGLTAHDPESTALVFSWSANQGSILSTRGTSTSSEVDWRAPACLDGAAVLTATIVDAGGATTRQQFSIAPRAGSSCGGLAVSGVRNSHRVLAEGNVIVVPIDLSGVTIGAWVPTVDGTSYEWRPGSGTAGGTFLIPNVERTPYLLQLGINYLWSSSRTLDLSGAGLGRPDVVLEPDTTQLQLQLSGLAPWQAGDDFQLHSTNAGIGYFSAPNCASPSGLSPADGATQLSEQIDYVFSLQNCGSPGARIEPARGDVLYATQLVSRSDAATSMNFQEVRRSFQTSALGGGGGGPLVLSGTMTELPLTNQTVDYRATSFEALALAGHPTATPGTNFLNIGTLPGYGQFGSFAGWPDLALVDSPAGRGDLLTVFTYGNPYPRVWPQFVTSQSTARVRYSVPLEGGGESTPRVFSVYTYAQQPLASGPLMPQVGPPRDLRLNGAEATGSLMGVGLTPLASWAPPSVGTPHSYAVRVYELFATGTGVTSRLQVTVLTTTQTQVRLPPGVLTAGKYYHLQVTAVFQPASDPSRPYMSGPVYHTAMGVTGRFQP